MFRYLLITPSLCLSLLACMRLENAVKVSYKHELYIDYKYVAFEGTSAQQNIYFQIDSINGNKYWGVVVLNHRDTISVNGYNKGGNYRTYYKTPSMSEEGVWDIWCSMALAQIPDSIGIEEVHGIHSTSPRILPEHSTLYRIARCK